MITVSVFVSPYEPCLEFLRHLINLIAEVTTRLYNLSFAEAYFPIYLFVFIMNSYLNIQVFLLLSWCFSLYENFKNFILDFQILFCNLTILVIFIYHNCVTVAPNSSLSFIQNVADYPISSRTLK